VVLLNSIAIAALLEIPVIALRNLRAPCGSAVNKYFNSPQSRGVAEVTQRMHYSNRTTIKII
jgi:hypothetical protein